VIVICAYEPGLARATAQLLGRRVVSALALP
jgi:hypothetical protein